MIQNIVFDMGNVLIRFDRRLFLNRLTVSAEEKELLLREVFAAVEWAQLDRGSKTEATALESIRQRIPAHLVPAAEQLLFRWDDPLVPIPGMYELVEELKANGYGIYLLSNASVRQHEYWPNIPVSRFFMGKVISADEGVVKPQPEIYQVLLERFGLTAESCLFIDDVAANVEGAMHCGLSGVVFHGDVSALRQALRRAGVQIGESYN